MAARHKGAFNEALQVAATRNLYNRVLPFASDFLDNPGDRDIFTRFNQVYKKTYLKMPWRMPAASIPPMKKTFLQPLNQPSTSTTLSFGIRVKFLFEDSLGSHNWTTPSVSCQVVTSFVLSGTCWRRPTRSHDATKASLRLRTLETFSD